MRDFRRECHFKTGPWPSKVTGPPAPMSAVYGTVGRGLILLKVAWRFVQKLTLLKIDTQFR